MEMRQGIYSLLRVFFFANSTSSVLYCIEFNQITVISSLPRRLAVKALRQTQLSQVFESRVSPENLVSVVDERASHVGLKNPNQPIIRCCALMKSPPLVSVYIDANSRNLLTAKRIGLTCVGIQGIKCFFCRVGRCVVDLVQMLHQINFLHSNCCLY